MRTGTGFRAALAAILLAAGPAAAADRIIRMGYQKYGTVILEKARFTLEKRLAPLHVRVTWTEFPGGPALMEAMGADSIDVGNAGDCPPIFAQAAGTELVYIGSEPASPHGEAIIVAENSPIRSIADLRGHKIALNKGSNVHNLLVQVLAEGGLKPADVQAVFLKPSDARPAFENGSVDAWAIWDPYLAAAQAGSKTRIIADGQAPDGRIVDANHQFFLASRAFAAANPDIIQALLADLRANETYGAAHRDEVAKLLAGETGIDVAVVSQAVGRLPFGVLPIDDSIIASQQAIADTMAGLGLIPAKINLQDARLR